MIPWKIRRTDDVSRKEFRTFQAEQHKFREQIMATIAELQSGIDNLATTEAVLVTEVTQVGTDVVALRAAFDALKAGGKLTPADQASLDAAMQKVTDSTAALVKANTDLKSTDASATGNPVVP